MPSMESEAKKPKRGRPRGSKTRSPAAVPIEAAKLSALNEAGYKGKVLPPFFRPQKGDGWNSKVRRAWVLREKKSGLFIRPPAGRSHLGYFYKARLYTTYAAVVRSRELLQPFGGGDPVECFEIVEVSVRIAASAEQVADRIIDDLQKRAFKSEENAQLYRVEAGRLAREAERLRDQAQVYREQGIMPSSYCPADGPSAHAARANPSAHVNTDGYCDPDDDPADSGDEGAYLADTNHELGLGAVEGKRSPILDDADDFADI